MFVRLVYESFRRQKRRKVLAGAAITLGVTVATGIFQAMMSVELVNEGPVTILLDSEKTF